MNAPDPLRGIRPIQLGQTEFLPVFLAPLSGLTDAPCRRIARSLGVPMVVSEMIASEAVIEEHKDNSKLPDWHSETGPLAVQLAGTEPELIAKAAKIVAELGADIIDLNFGCPARRVVKKVSGSALMRDPGLCAEIFAATVEAVEIPVTVKMRLGWDDDLLTGVEIAGLAERAGVQMLSVHGRTRCQFYNGHSAPERIRPIVDSVTIPVVVNGDITSVADARAAIAASGGQGVMIGRAAIGNPWLLLAVVSATGAIPDQASAAPVIVATAIEHLNGLLADPRFCDRPPRIAIQNFRKHLSGYLQCLGVATDVHAQFMCIDEPDALASLLQAYHSPFPCD